MISMAYADAKYQAGYEMKDYVSAATAFIPDAYNVTEPTKMAIAWIPQIIKPELELIFNVKTFPSVRSIESQGALTIPSENRKKANDSMAATFVAQTDIAKSLRLPVTGKGLSANQIDVYLQERFGRSIGFLTGKPSAFESNAPDSIFDPTRKEFFSSSKTVQNFYDRAEELEQQKNAVNKDLVFISDEDNLVLNAKLNRVKEIRDLLGDLDDTLGVEANPVRRQIFEKINEFNQFSEKDVTEVDREKLRKKEATSEWSADRIQLLDKYMGLYTESKETMKATKLEKQLKEEMG